MTQIGERERDRKHARMIFDYVFERYRLVKAAVKDNEGVVHLRPYDERHDDGWKPQGVRALFFLADFERIGRAALHAYGNGLTAVSTGEADRRWSDDARDGRLRVWEAYFVGGLEYRQAIRCVGAPPGTFDYWFQDVKTQLGFEFLRVGFFCRKREEPGNGNGHGVTETQEATDG